MSGTLQVVYASAPSGAVVVHTLELSHPSFEGGAIRLSQGFEDVQASLETGELVTFRASGFGVSLPQKAVKGRQDLSFQLDNVTGEAARAIRSAVDSGEPVRVIYRAYLASNLSGPAQPPIVMTAMAAKGRAPSVTVTATFHDLVNKAWPRRRYTPTFAPGLKYFE